MYLVGDSFRVSFKWVVIISTKQARGCSYTECKSLCYTLLSKIIILEIILQR